MNSLVFNSPTIGKLSLEDLILRVSDFIGEDRRADYKLVIGTDSHSHKENGLKAIDFVTAIVIYRVGKGGRYFWHKEKREKIGSLRDKIYTETILSLEMAQKLVPKLKEALIGLAPYDLEIHIDVGESGPTREMIKEVTGMVTGNGYVAKIKPEGYGAYVVADKHT